MPIVDPDRTASPQHVLEWQMLVEMLEQVPEIQNALANLDSAVAAADAAAAAAQAAADNANAAAEASASETSIVNSFVTNFTPPVVQADDAGNVTIGNHQRQYGDTALNPTVNVTGDMVATGAVNPAVVRIYYSDPSRAGGAVTYQFTVDPADPPVQGGDVHVVGAVEIPATGTSDGGFVTPPGFTGTVPVY